MRAAVSVLLVGVITFSRTYRPLTGAPGATLVTFAVFPRICATVVQVAPSAETRMSASRVFQVDVSPPAPALRRVNDWIAKLWPRSTWRNFAIQSFTLRNAG